MAELFDTTKQNISLHNNNNSIYFKNSKIGRKYNFGKLYLKIKDKMSIILTICLSMAFFLLIIGHFLNISFIYKVIIMSLGFFLILATRDSFQVYIEDVALSISNKEEQQKIMIDIEVYRK